MRKADGCGAGSKYIYDLYYEKEAISKPLYEWLLKNNYADANLIAKWKKQGYEKVCCAPFLGCVVLCFFVEFCRFYRRLPGRC